MATKKPEAVKDPLAALKASFMELIEINRKLSLYIHDTIARPQEVKVVKVISPETQAKIDKAREFLRGLLLNEDPNLCNAFAQMLDIILDSNLSNENGTSSEDSKRLQRGCIVVPIGNSNGHDYTIGEPCMVYQGQQCLKMTGMLGNSLIVSSLSQTRLADPQEINRFFDSLIERSKTDAGLLSRYISAYTNICTRGRALTPEVQKAIGYIPPAEVKAVKVVVEKKKAGRLSDLS